MKAVAVFPSQREVKLVDLAPPTLVSPTQARIRILDVGVCGTDREICAFDYGTPPAGADQLVIGHEALGEVVEVGPRVTRMKVGDLVVPMVRRPCEVPSCTACRAEHARHAASPRRPGSSRLRQGRAEFGLDCPFAHDSPLSGAMYARALRRVTSQAA